MISHTIRVARLLATFTAALIVLPGSVAAQSETVFAVTVEDKTPAHPENGNGWPEAFAIDGQQGVPVTVVRGRTYVFQLQDVPAIHPFYITTSAAGVGAEPYSDGVEGNFSTGNETVTFTPSESTPDLLYYQCGSHEFMGWRIYVRDEVEIGLRTVADGLTTPVALAQPDDGTERLFIVQQTGQIRVVLPDGTLLEEPFLDVTDRMVELRDNFDERGLLGLDFHPEYSSNGLFYVYYSAPLRDSAPSGWDNTSVIAEFQVSDADPNVADPESERILLQVDQPQFNHAGGTVRFGLDGMLYVSLGDGGGADDNQEGHVDDWYEDNAGGNAQNVEANLLGSILRINVAAGSPFEAPSDNPFVGRDGLDEIFAYGLRNPYRFSIDLGGEYGLLAGDAGQNRFEEVNQVVLGGNYGWNVMEGTHCFDAENPDSDVSGCPTEVMGDHPDAGAPLITPVIEYLNGNQEGGLGLAVVGGVVYRGESVDDFAGRYIFGDWSSDFGAPAGQLFVAEPVDDGRWPFQSIRVVNRPGGELGHYLLAVEQDRSGEAYVLTTDIGGPSGESGRVYQIVSPSDVTAQEDPDQLPRTLTLAQNYPNPFNPVTTIRFSVPQAGRVTLAVYDVLGRRVATLLDEVLAAGAHSVSWDARDDLGQSLASGAYVYRLHGAGTTLSRVMTVLK